MRIQTLGPRTAACWVIGLGLMLACHKQAAVRTDTGVDRTVSKDTARVVSVPDKVVLAAFADTAPGAVFFSAGKTYKLQTSADRQSLSAVIRKERDRWRAAKPQDYRFLLRVGCFCPGPRGWQLIEIQSGQPVKAWAAHGRSASLTDWNTISIDRVYDALERFAENDGEVHVAFEPRWHFPTYIRASGGRMPDGWSVLEARALRPLP